MAAVSGVNLIAVSVSLLELCSGPAGGANRSTRVAVQLRTARIPSVSWRYWCHSPSFMVPAVLLAFGAASKTAEEAIKLAAVRRLDAWPATADELFPRQTKAPWWDVGAGERSVCGAEQGAAFETIATSEWLAMIAI